jgi:hypothetical protein
MTLECRRGPWSKKNLTRIEWWVKDEKISRHQFNLSLKTHLFSVLKGPLTLF